MTIYTVLIVEDDTELRQRFSNMFNEDEAFKLLGAVGTKSDGLAALEEYKPDALLTDLGLPDGSGVDIIKAIEPLQIDTQAMVISGFQDEHRVFDALEAGASAYILKHDTNQKITDAITSMMNGGAPISPVIARLMLKKFKFSKDQSIKLPETLTKRQINILKLVSQGFSSQEIAEKLDISYYTVTTHIKNIYGKLQVNSRTEAIFEAKNLGLF